MIWLMTLILKNGLLAYQLTNSDHLKPRCGYWLAFVEIVSVTLLNVHVINAELV